MSTHETGTFSFDDLSQFSLHETIDNKDHLLLDIHGTITLTSASTSTQDAAVVANISMTTKHIEIDHTNYDTTPDSLTIRDPSLKKRSYFRRPTLTLDITLSIKPNTTLTDLTIDTRHLHIELDPSLDLTIRDKTTLSAVSGHIASPSIAPKAFTSREKHLRSVSGGIRGSYKLEDLLSCRTTSGGIEIGVVPLKAGKDVAPARLDAESTSGHIDVQYETADAPERDYIVDVRGASSEIRGTYIHGSRTQIMNGSGNKHLTIVPFDGKGGS